MAKKAKAIVMFSGGLDSMLAASLLRKIGVDVIGLNFYSPFFGNKNAEKSAKQIKLELVPVMLGKDYVNMLKKPKFGYGSGINPCIDCKIFMLKKARLLMKKYNADFIATGEVLGERPMSQHEKALEIIEQESGLKGKLLRPLSAKLLPETEIEKKLGMRESLLDIQGRSRKKQMELAALYNITAYPSPAGGCLLCEKEFAKKLKDLFEHSENPGLDEIESLKLGRHFRFQGKIIVGRNKDENDALEKLAKKLKAKIIECKNVVGPTTIVIGGKEAMEKAEELTAFYSDAVKQGIKSVIVNNAKINVDKINKDNLMRLRL